MPYAGGVSGKEQERHLDRVYAVSQASGADGVAGDECGAPGIVPDFVSPGQHHRHRLGTHCLSGGIPVIPA